MKQLGRLAAPAYLVAAMLVLFPVLDLVQTAWPPRFGQLPWRVLAVGLLSRLVLTPLLGLVLAFAAALILEQRRVLRGLAILNALLLLLLLVGVGVYGLDAVQMRARIGPESRTAYDLGVLISLAKFGIAVIIVLVLAIAAWKSGSALSGGKRRGASAKEPMVVREAARPAAPVDSESHQP